MVKWWNHYGVMVIWWNCPMVNRFFWETFPSIVKWWKVKMQFARWSEFCYWGEFFPPGHCPGGKLSLEIILSSWHIILEDMSCGIVLGVFVSRYNTWKHLTHYWDTICPRRCPGISLYFRTYDDTDLISSYTNLCVFYAMFFCIRLQYVLGDCPDISWGTLSPCGKIYPSSFIFRNVQ